VTIKRPSIEKSDYLSTGSTLLNLACTGMPDCGFAKGMYFWMAGDSSSGKTMLALTLLAEAANNKNWDDYELIFDDVEGGALMDMEAFFGKKMSSKVEIIHSEIAEQFYFGLDDRLALVEQGKAAPFLYLLDSMDALSTDYEGKKFGERKQAFRDGKKAPGDYGDGKAKINSTWIRTIVSRLRDTKCSLIVLSQTRDNIGGTIYDPPSTTAGGRALKFYATLQLWSVVGSKLVKTVNGKKRQIGVNTRFTVKKNRMSGREWSVEIPIYYSVGIDDIGSCVDFLVDEKYWSRAGDTIDAHDIGVRARKPHLIAAIEKQGLEFNLRQTVAEVWRDIADKCQEVRKSRYE
jgi:recombination protein RecA